MTIVIREIRQTRENNLEPRDNSFDVLSAHFKWQVSNHQVAELALGVIAHGAATEQALHITDDRQGIEVCLQDYEVKAMGGHRQEGGDGGVARI